MSLRQQSTPLPETNHHRRAPDRHSLHNLDTARLARRVVMFPPTLQVMERLLGRWADDVGAPARPDAIRRVMSANPAAIQAFARRDRFDWAQPEAEGFVAFLPLTNTGHSALLAGEFDMLDPSPFHLAGQHQAAASIYFAGIYAPGSLAGGVGLAYEAVSTPLRRDADLYSRAATPNGRRLVEGLGFEPIGQVGDPRAEDLYVFRRVPREEQRPIYDTYPSLTRSLTVGVVRTSNELAKVMAVRSAAYIAEQHCPYEEEFDGHDFASTHLLGYVGSEPAASIRIRCFADFAKVERLAVLPRFRNSRLSFVIVRAAHELCRAKGYRRIYGHAQKRLVAFWEKSSGAKVLNGGREFRFSDHDYVEMVAEAEPHPDAISLRSDPYVIIRPEGRWHEPGVLDRSGARPAARTSAG